MTTIGIVGAGAAAAAATHVLDTAVPDATIVVLEKSGGLCGRAATRRNDERDLVYDYGANYVKSANDRITTLLTETLDDEGMVDATAPIYTFDATGEVSPGRDSDEHKWSYRTGLTQIAKRLFAATDANVHRRTRVETVHHETVDEGESSEAHAWTLVDDDGKEWGPFDALVMNPPAPQTAALLASAAWDAPACERLQAAAEAVPYRSVWTAVLHYPFEIDKPYYGLVNTDKDHAVGWISREECKDGHVPDGESLLVVQAGGEWSTANYDAEPAKNVATLADHAAAILSDERLSTPDWTDHQGWRYAIPEAGVEPEPVEAATEYGLYCTGDWVGGEGRIHVALANGLDVGEQITEDL